MSLLRDTILVPSSNNSLDKYKLIGGYTYQKEYETALLKFGFTKEDKYKKLSEVKYMVTVEYSEAVVEVLGILNELEEDDYYYEDDK